MHQLSNTTSQHITTCHNGGKAPVAPSTWVSMEDDERVDDVDGIPEPLKQMTLGGPFTGRFRFFERQIRKVLGGYLVCSKFFAVHHILGCFFGIK